MYSDTTIEHICKTRLETVAGVKGFLGFKIRHLKDAIRVDMFLDVDNFKQINDSGGHSAGDLVLRRVGAALRGMIRSGDAAVRLGGEEFLLLLRDADRAGAERIAVEFRDRLAALSLPRSCLPRATLTVSIGIAILPHNGIVLAELVRAADVAMYEAKRAGGDRYQLSTHRPDSRRAGRSKTSIQGVA